MFCVIKAIKQLGLIIVQALALINYYHFSLIVFYGQTYNKIAAINALFAEIQRT